jgi:hypothetical protein
VIFVGIDPGKSGAIAVIDGGAVLIFPVPLITAQPGRGKDEYDVAEIARLFGAFSPESFVVVEKPQPIPPTIKAGSHAQFQRGVQFGFAWMLEALRIPYQLVAPRTWQRVMHEGTPGDDTKQRSILAAQRLFPGVDLRRSSRARKADDGMAESLLLAEYARRTKNGGNRG